MDRVEIELGAGLTALTGETGAGKSILVDALVLALGGRASPDIIRKGQARAEVTAIFDLTKAPELRTRLKAIELETDEDECIVRRTVSGEGRSRAFINGRAVPNQALRDLSQGVVEVHSQHAHHSLLRTDHQRELLDHLGDHDTQLNAVRIAHGRLSELTHSRETLTGEFNNRDERLDYLRYQLEELHALAVKEDEHVALEVEQRRLASAQTILGSCSELITLLWESEHSNVAHVVRDAGSRAQGLIAFDTAFGDVARCLDNALIEVEEATRSLRKLAETIEISPSQLASVEDRLSALFAAARKHRVGIAELPARARELEREVRRLAAVDSDLADLAHAIEEATSEYDRAAAALREARISFVPSLSASINDALADLGMDAAKFSVLIDSVSDGEKRTLHGSDHIEFFVAANPGSEPAPLRRVASGGELSRISLALQVTGATRIGSNILIFDEVDVGIGGGVAERIGRRLREVGQTRQVLCVTHLPQVAVQANRHLRVDKREVDNGSVTSLEEIEGQGRVEEIARMLGGVEITSRTLAHAREMLGLLGTE